jgi:prepilin-type N-terminal cleavage/methylation domain-containing protein/prepilin-type processing-associated H-X9-DG protein
MIHHAHAHQQASRGFTLIELLVVIAIISLLVAMLLPVLANAREAAKAVICKTKMHQTQLAVELYRNDFKAYFPPDALIERADHSEPAYLDNPPYRFELLIPTYFNGSPDLTTYKTAPAKNPLMCPSNPAPAGMTLAQARATGYWNGGATGNYQITAQFGYNNSSVQYKIRREVKGSPSHAILLLETFGSNYYRTGASGGMSTVIYFHPDMTMNIAAADGHVVASKAVSTAQLQAENLDWAADRDW